MKIEELYKYYKQHFLVDTDTRLRQKDDKLTNKRVINQVVERLHATTPNLSKGFYDVDVESVIRPGDFTTDQRPCGSLSGVTIGNYFTPMIPNDFHAIWKKGIESNAFYLKLCGSGGGGFILGFTRDYKKAEPLLVGYDHEVIYKF